MQGNNALVSGVTAEFCWFSAAVEVVSSAEQNYRWRPSTNALKHAAKHLHADFLRAVQCGHNQILLLLRQAPSPPRCQK